jgi:Fic family protein
MPSLDAERLRETTIPLSTGWLLAACTEAKGKQDLWMRQKPEVLEALREQAIVQSAESSNRIEGVTVERDRLRPLVLGHAKPRDRSEEEVAGYRKAIDWVFTRRRRVTIDPRVIQHLHALAQGGMSADAGRWKRKDNEIIEILASGDRRIRFKPTSAKETPKAIMQLCRNYLAACDGEKIPALLVIATFVFDLLCVHPFRDGNGRVSRLVTTLLLLEHGFEVVRYVSLERLVEESKAEYYPVLQGCSAGWHSDKNEIVPWWNYFLGIVRRAYQEFATQVQSAAPRAAKGDLVRQAIAAQVGPFVLADLRGQLPTVSPQLVKKVLAEMKRAGKVRVIGRGRGATWEQIERDREPRDGPK